MYTSSPTLATVALSLLAAIPSANAAGLYTKNSPVVQVDAKNYDRLVAKSNYTTVRHNFPSTLFVHGGGC